MNEISIVRRRSRFLPALLIVILLAILALAVFWFFGDRAPATFDFSSIMELERNVGPRSGA
jgi:multidrug resistance efflux pump